VIEMNRRCSLPSGESASAKPPTGETATNVSETLARCQRESRRSSIAIGMW